jgi:hypothetical protein
MFAIAFALTFALYKMMFAFSSINSTNFFLPPSVPSVPLWFVKNSLRFHRKPLSSRHYFQEIVRKLT